MTPTSFASGTLCGTIPVTLDQLKTIKTPKPHLRKKKDSDKTYAVYKPLPHHQFIQDVKTQIKAAGFSIVDQQHGIAQVKEDNRSGRRDGTINENIPLRFTGDRYFGLLHIAPQPHQPAGMVIGLRNGHDKRLSASIVHGSKVFVCSNLIFTSELRSVQSQRHDGNLEDNLPLMINRAIEDFRITTKHHQKRIEAYQEAQIENKDAHHFIVEMCRNGAFGARQMKSVIDEWHDQLNTQRRNHIEDFTPRTIWSLHNATTEVMKTTRIGDLPDRSLAIHKTLDPLVGLSR